MTIEEKVFERKKFIPEKLLQYGQAGIYPAHHMNHKYWISVVLNEEIEDEKIMTLIDLSYNITNEK